MNVVCGQLLTSLYGTEKTFQLGMPTVSQPADDLWRELSQGDEVVFFLVDEMPIILHLFFIS